VTLSKALFTRYTLLSNRIDNRLYRVYKHSTGDNRLSRVYSPLFNRLSNRYQTGCTTLFDNRLNEQWLFVQHGCQTGCTTWVDNRIDNWLDVCLHDTAGCQTGCTTGLTTGCVV